MQHTQNVGDSSDALGRADRLDESVHSFARLLPHLLRERGIPLGRVRVVELVGVETARLGTELGGLGDHPLDQLLGGLASFARELHHRRAERPHVVALLAAEGVRRDERDGDSASRAHERERGTGTPSCVLHDSSRWLQASTSDGAIDDRERHAVLHAPGRVAGLDLHQHASEPVRYDATELDQRGTTNCFEDAGGAFHLTLPCAGRTSNDAEMTRVARRAVSG